jgi:hypothetical protein
MVFPTKMNGYQKIYNINKNVTKMGMIIKKVYCISKAMNKVWFFKYALHSGILILQKQVKISNIQYSYPTNISR